ncbi:glucose-6-phosphate isomerase [Candidatus Saccharibacteria bacterium]|nr:glucose-6-phosphate isomerase [Candidatus Saccharibacteria bacterium]
MITVNFNPVMDATETAQVLAEIRADKMSGWLELPRRMQAAGLDKIKGVADRVINSSKVVVLIGIGGSYLGHRAIIEALRPKSRVKIVYAGNSLSYRELLFAMNEVGNQDFSIVVMSKSGTTLEPAIAFKEFKKKLIEKYGPVEAMKRIYVVTDGKTGTLHDEAIQNRYIGFAVPGNVGGRYSVLSTVGLLPLAIAGVNIDELIAGAVDAEKEAAIKYAWMRYTLGERGYDTEVFASFEPATMYFNEWLKQLFGESEGKEKQGILPTSVIYSTDLHSLGQFMQDGRRNLFETVIDFPTDEMNAKAVKAVRKAHADGGIPVLNIKISSFDERGFGELIYFFELACAVSATLFGVNPFDQPGVEAYKAELKKLIQG